MTNGWRPAWELEDEARVINAQPWDLGVVINPSLGQT
jgi:hypothetical protein